MAPSTPAPAGSRYGLVIGVEDYSDARLNLRCARNDARAVYDLMIDPACGTFSPDNVKLLLDAQATRDGVWRAMSWLKRSAGLEDTLWLYYAGHAAPEADCLYWVLHDSDVDDLYGSGLSGEQVHQALSSMRCGRRVVMLDCCYAAAMSAQSNPTRDIFNPAENSILRKKYPLIFHLCVPHICRERNRRNLALYLDRII